MVVTIPQAEVQAALLEEQRKREEKTVRVTLRDKTTNGTKLALSHT